MAFGVGRGGRGPTAAMRAFSAVTEALRAVWPRRRRTGGAHVSWSRREAGGVVRLACEIEVPPRQAVEVRDAVAAAVAEAVAGLGLVIGSVGIVPDEEPLLVALAPRRDIVAPRFRDELAIRSGRPEAHLWLALAPGTYLASVVSPYRAFSDREGDVAAFVRNGKAACALRSECTRTSRGVRLALEVYSPRSELRKLLSLARKGLDASRGRPQLLQALVPERREQCLC